MKNIFVFFIAIFFGVISCRNNDENTQKIDQTVRLYIDSAGIDMLNTTNDLAYKNIAFTDIYSDENSSVSFSAKTDKDSIQYREYVAGATRKLVDDSDKNNLIYESKIALQITRNSNNATTNTNDTLTLKYSYTPTLFQVNKAFYNNQEITMETSDNAHLIKIQK